MTSRILLAWFISSAFAVLSTGAALAQDPTALADEANALIDRGDLGAAESKLTAALGLDRTHAEANVAMGRLKFLRGDLAGAQQLANVALSKDRGNAQALILLVRVQEGPDQVAATLRRIEELANVLRDDPGVQLAHAEALLAAGRFDAAQTAATRVLKLRETSVPAMKVLARSYLGLERPVTAESILVRALELERDPEALTMLAGIRYAERNFVEARLLVEEALAEHPGFVEGLNSLGAIYAVVRNWDGAADALNRALAISPNFVEAWLNLGVAQRGAGQFEQAETSWKRVLALAPRNSDAWYNLGVLHLDNPMASRDRLQQLTEAINAFNAYKDRVTNADPNADKYIEEARLLIKQEQDKRTEQLKPPPEDGTEDGGPTKEGDGG